MSASVEAQCAVAPKEPAGETKPQSYRPLYILDTSVLYELLQGPNERLLNPQAGATLYRQANYLIRKCDVVIPGLAVLEVMAQFFHQRIDIKDYRKWHTTRYSLFEQRILNCINYCTNVTLHREIPNIRDLLNHGSAPLEVETVTELQSHYERIAQGRLAQKAKGKGIHGINDQGMRDREPKFFDGNDLIIFEEAIMIANANNDRKCVFVSSDKILRCAVSDLSRRARTDFRLPTNLRFLDLRDVWRRRPVAQQQHQQQQERI